MKQKSTQYLLVILFLALLIIMIKQKSMLEDEQVLSLPSPTMTILPAKIAVSNIKTTMTQDGFIQTTANLSLSPIGKGTIKIIAPSKMLIGETETVKFVVVPEHVLFNSTATPSPNITPQFLLQQHQRYKATQQVVEMYPVLIAELKGPYFQILPNEPIQKIVTADSIVEWLWAVTPLAPDKQILLLSLSTPVTVGNNRDIFDAMEIATLSITIDIQPSEKATFIPTISALSITVPTATAVPTPTATQPPPSNRITEQIVNNIDTIISAILAFLGTALTAYVTYIINKNNKSNN